MMKKGMEESKKEVGSREPRKRPKSTTRNGWLVTGRSGWFTRRASLGRTNQWQSRRSTRTNVIKTESSRS